MEPRFGVLLGLTVGILATALFFQVFIIQEVPEENIQVNVITEAAPQSDALLVADDLEHLCANYSKNFPIHGIENEKGEGGEIILAATAAGGSVTFSAQDMLDVDSAMKQEKKEAERGEFDSRDVSDTAAGVAENESIHNNSTNNNSSSSISVREHFQPELHEEEELFLLGDEFSSIEVNNNFASSSSLSGSSASTTIVQFQLKARRWTQFEMLCENVPSTENAAPESINVDEPLVTMIAAYRPRHSEWMVDILGLSVEIAAKKAGTPPETIIVVLDRPREDAKKLCDRDIGGLRVMWFPNLGTPISMARRMATFKSKGRWLVFGEVGDYYVPGWLRHGRVEEMKGKQHDLSQFDGKAKVVFWNTIDGMNGYSVPPTPVAFGDEDPHGFLTTVFPSGLALIPGSFAVWRNSLLKAGGYPLLVKPQEEEGGKEGGGGGGGGGEGGSSSSSDSGSSSSSSSEEDDGSGSGSGSGEDSQEKSLDLSPTVATAATTISPALPQRHFAAHYQIEKEETDEVVFRHIIAVLSPSSLSLDGAQYDEKLRASYVHFSNRCIFADYAPSSSPTPFLSVVIASGGDRAKLLRVMLLAMMLQTTSLSEVVVVLAGNDYGQSVMLNRFWKDQPRVRVMSADGGEYGHAARQVGVAASTGEYVLITNDDNYYAPIFTETMLSIVHVRSAKNQQPNMLHYSMIHDYDLYMNYRFVMTKFAFGEIDIGSAIVHGDIARRVGYPFREKNSDFLYFEVRSKKLLKVFLSALPNTSSPLQACKQFAQGRESGASLERILFVHN